MINLPKMTTAPLTALVLATALASAMGASKARFPRIGGMLLRCGHDCCPTPANTSIIDYHGNPKPAARALARIWKNDGENKWRTCYP